ncbi:MAG: molybdenum cofactor guanylyltransferase [Methanobacteriota archaeon]|nr:MAG: molybdenum cofactor guanylyltransferase [Euryarchaeota archaeon]
MILLADISIAILTGGKSRRFGSNKLVFEVDGKKLVHRVYDKVHDFSDDVFFQGNSVEDLQSSKDDIMEGKGPLGGIYSALKNSRYEKTIVLAGDLPHVDTRILDELSSKAGADLVVPRWRNGHREPLCALYSRALVLLIEQMLERGDMKISHLFDQVERIEWIDIDDLIESGRLDEDCFRNLNRQQDASGRHPH